MELVPDEAGSLRLPLTLDPFKMVVPKVQALGHEANLRT